MAYDYSNYTHASHGAMDNHDEPAGEGRNKVQMSKKSIDYHKLGHKVEHVATGSGINKKDAKPNVAVKAFEILKHSQPSVSVRPVKNVFIEGLRIYEPMAVDGEGNFGPVEILNLSVHKSKKSIDYYYKYEGDLLHYKNKVDQGRQGQKVLQGENYVSCTIVIEGKTIAIGTGMNKKDARRKTAANVLEILKDSHPSFTQEVSNKKNGKNGPKIDESSIGNQLLRKMGWTGSGGLGKDADGISEPIVVDAVKGRKGFGQIDKQMSQKLIKKQKFKDNRAQLELILMKFVDEQEEEIKISGDLANGQGALIYKISRKYGLTASRKARAIKEGEYLVISKKK